MIGITGQETFGGPYIEFLIGIVILAEFVVTAVIRSLMSELVSATRDTRCILLVSESMFSTVYENAVPELLDVDRIGNPVPELLDVDFVGNPVPELRDVGTVGNLVSDIMTVWKYFSEA